MLNPLDDQFLQQLRAAFAIEAEEHTAAISERLLELEQSGEDAHLSAAAEKLYREVHSLKGAARAVSAGSIEGLCQALETLLDDWKRLGFAMTAASFDVLQEAAADIRRNLEKGDPGPADRHTLELIAALKGLPIHEPRAPEISGTRAPSATAEVPVPEVSGPEAPANIVVPEPTAPEPETRSVNQQEPVAAPAAKVPPPPEEKPVSRGATETVRLSTTQLDLLLLQAEELLLVKQAAQARTGQLQALRTSFEDWRKQWSKVQGGVSTTPAGKMSGSRGTVTDFQEFLEWHQDQLAALEEQVNSLWRNAEQERRVFAGLIDNLLEDAKRLLTLPFSHVLAGMPLMVRDLGRQLEKDVTLEMSGTEVQIDKRILEEIKDPLIHLLRNAVDHGVETPEERFLAGKQRTAVIRLDVRQTSGSDARVSVRDDGRGIDTGAVVEVAREKGVLSGDDLDTPDDAAAMELIFASAVSTSRAVTEISGRGLGMAIVREKVEKLGGRVAFESRLGQGTTFHLILPLTLATLRGVLVRTRGHLVLVPLAGMARALRIPTAEVRRVASRETVAVAGLNGREVLPLLDLGASLGLTPMKPAEKAEAANSTMVALLLKDGEKRAVFSVEEVLGEQEVLIKPLAWPLVRLKNIAGSTVLSAGKVVPVLNTADLLAGVESGTMVPSPAVEYMNTEPEATEGETAPNRILIAEDSITSRMLLKHILESSGYHVRTAVDGMDAVENLQRESYDLVVSDVDMPRMNGFDLTAYIRASAPLAGLPVILVTARDSREDRERGVEVGANAYIVKSSFDQSDLLQVIRRLI